MRFYDYVRRGTFLRPVVFGIDLARPGSHDFSVECTVRRLPDGKVQIVDICDIQTVQEPRS